MKASSIGIVVFAIVVAIAALVLSAAAFAAVLMVGLSLLSDGAPAVPALGFFESLGALIVLGCIGTALKGAKAEVK